jgi:uncharacterized delta-60 repeat protein
MANTLPFFGGNGNPGQIYPQISKNDYGVAVQTLSDGKFVVMGTWEDHPYLARYLADGSIDTRFGTNGVVKAAFGTVDYASAMAVQADGKIVITGYTATNASELMLMRFTVDGKLDTSFSGDGVVAFSYGDAIGTSIDVMKDGTILVAAYQGSMLADHVGVRLLGFHPDGGRASMFSTSDEYKFTNSFTSNGHKVRVHEDGNIYLYDANRATSTEINDIAIQRMKPNGVLDTSFDPLSTAHSAFGMNLFLRDVAVQADGKTIIAAVIETGPSYTTRQDLVLIRFDGNKIDTSFGVNGMARHDLSDSDAFSKVFIQPDGKIVVAGSVTVLADVFKDWSPDPALVRFDANGKLDTSFGINGVARTNLGTYDSVFGAAMQADGKVILTGRTGTPDSDTFILRYNADGSPDTSFGMQQAGYTPPTFTENGAAVIVDAKLTVTDAELASHAFGYYNATLTLSRHTPNANDVFSASGRLGPLTKGQNLSLGGTVVAGVLKLRFAMNASQSAVNEVLRSIAYTNTSDQPEAVVKLEWQFCDGNVGLQGTGGSLTAVTSTNVQVVAVNDAPSGQDGAATLLATASYTLGSKDFTFADPEDGAALTALRIDTLPASGNLRFQDTAVTAGQTITAADLAAGRLTYAGSGLSDAANFMFSVQDSKGAFDAAPNTMAFANFLPTQNGTAGNDVLASTRANDKFFGSAGTDTAQFIGPRANYTVSNAKGTISVTDNKGVDGADQLLAFERIKFSDMHLAFDVDGTGGQAYRMYQAAFNRAPDVGGLGFWIDAMDKGMSRDKVAQFFVESPEFKAMYGAAPTNAHYVTKFYENVLHRAPDAEGFAFWTKLMDTNMLNAGQVLAYFSESPENQAALVGVITAGVSYLPQA